MRSSVSTLRASLVASMLERLRGVAAADAAAVQIARQLLMPLEREDEERGNNLIATLRAYYAFGTRVDKTADALFLHRNSVRYRLDRVRRLMALDIDVPNVITALTIALACTDRMALATDASEDGTHAG